MEEEKRKKEKEQKERESFHRLVVLSGSIALERGLVKRPQVGWQNFSEPIQPMIISKQIIVYIIGRVGLEEVESGYHKTRLPYDLSDVWESIKPQFPWVRNPMAFLNSLFNMEKEFLFLEFKITTNPKTNHKEVVFTLNDSRWIDTSRLPKEVLIDYPAGMCFHPPF